MGILNRLFGSHDSTAVADAPEMSATEECTHGLLTPHWDSLDDMGDETRANSWECTACGQEFSPEMAEQIQSDVSDRIQRIADEADDQASSDE